MLELFADVLLFWFPFYYTLKIGFLIWLQHPSSRGAEYLYRNVLRAPFLRVNVAIETFIADAGGGGGLSAASQRLLSRDAGAAAAAATTGARQGGAVQRGAASAAPDPALIFGEQHGTRHVD